MSGTETQERQHPMDTALDRLGVAIDQLIEKSQELAKEVARLKREADER